ncbi:MAG: hypothetical protein K8F59_08505 [Rhodobacteraceae bacterium]|nr:hypothetical protein [Paracoccaceae bacterium]
MEYTVTHDDLGTHLDWSLEGVTAHEVDWFWSNMEKCFILWHPEQHETLSWPVPPVHGNPIGAIHNAPQTWDDGRRQDLYIRFEAIEWLKPELRDVIAHDHVIIAAGLGFGDEALEKADPMGYRLHQWSKSDRGITGKSSALPTRIPETVEQGKIWAAHCAQEIGNWEVFLPQLYRLYKVVTDTRRNPCSDMTVEGKGRNAYYKFISA